MGAVSPRSVRTLKMKYKIGDVVQVRAAGTQKPAEGDENLWEIVGIDGNDCAVRNMYDEYRANQSNKHTAAQWSDVSLFLVWKGKLPIQFR